MAEAQKIKLTIADRVYPLTVSPSQEEGLRRAAKEIEEMIKKFEKSYAVRDKQDVLAMCALQFASKTIQKELDSDADRQKAIQQIESLEQMLKEQLS